MVVPSNRRSFLATLRNVAIAAGVCSPAIASPIIQSTENPEGLPVVQFDEKGVMLVDPSWVFDPEFNVVGLKPKYYFEAGCWRGALRVWIPKTTPAMISDYAYQYADGLLESSVISGEAVLIKTQTQVAWYMLHANNRTIIARVCNSFITQQTIDLRSANF